MRPLCNHTDLPAGLLSDLLRSQLAGRDYPIEEKLAQLRAALSNESSLSLPESGHIPKAWRITQPLSWKVIALFAFGATGIVNGFVSRAAHERRVVDPAAGMQLSAAATDLGAELSQPLVVPTKPTALRVLPDTSAMEPTAFVGRSSVLTPSEARARGSIPATSPRREIAQLVRIRALLARDPAAAYRLAQRSEREFPRGLLGEERQALSIVALAKSGAHAAAVAKAHDYQARYPESPMRESIEAALQQDPCHEAAADGACQ